MADSYDDFLTESGGGGVTTTDDDSYAEFLRQQRQDKLAAQRAAARGSQTPPPPAGAPPTLDLAAVGLSPMPSAPPASAPPVAPPALAQVARTMVPAFAPRDVTRTPADDSGGVGLASRLELEQESPSSLTAAADHPLSAMFGLARGAGRFAIDQGEMVTHPIDAAEGLARAAVTAPYRALHGVGGMESSALERLGVPLPVDAQFGASASETAGGLFDTALLTEPAVGAIGKGLAMGRDAMYTAAAGEARFQSALERAQADAMAARNRKAGTSSPPAAGPLALPSGQYDLPAGDYTTRDAPETDPSRLLPSRAVGAGVPSDGPAVTAPIGMPAVDWQTPLDDTKRAAADAAATRQQTLGLPRALLAPSVEEQEGATRAAAVSADNTALRASPQEVDTYRLTRDAGISPSGREIGRPTPLPGETDAAYAARVANRVGIRDQAIERSAITGEGSEGAEAAARAQGQYSSVRTASGAARPIDMFPKMTDDALHAHMADLIDNQMGTQRGALNTAQAARLNAAEAELESRGHPVDQIWTDGLERGRALNAAATADRPSGHFGFTAAGPLAMIVGTGVGAAAGAALAPPGKRGEGAAAGALTALGLVTLGTSIARDGRAAEAASSRAVVPARGAGSEMDEFYQQLIDDQEHGAPPGLLREVRHGLAQHPEDWEALRSAFLGDDARVPGEEWRPVSTRPAPMKLGTVDDRVKVTYRGPRTGAVGDQPAPRRGRTVTDAVVDETLQHLTNSREGADALEQLLGEIEPSGDMDEDLRRATRRYLERGGGPRPRTGAIGDQPAADAEATPAAAVATAPSERVASRPRTGAIGDQPVERAKETARKKAIAEFGTTDDVHEAGWLLPDGDMLDFSEKKDGGEPGRRSADHRQIGAAYDYEPGHTAAMNQFRTEGNVRFSMSQPNHMSIDLTQGTLTEPQFRRIKEAMRSNPSVAIDLRSPTGEWIKDHGFEEGEGTHQDVRDWLLDNDAFKEAGRSRYGAADPKLIKTLGLAALGAGVGGLTGSTPGEHLRNAAFGAVAGGAVGAIASREARALSAGERAELGARATMERPSAGAKEAADAITATFAPQTRGQMAGTAGQVVRAARGKIEREVAIAQQTLDRVSGDLNKQPIAKKIRFMDTIEQGAKQGDASRQPVATSIRRTLDDEAHAIQDMGTGKLQQLIADYFPHLWQDPDRAGQWLAKIMGKAPMEGSKSFLKQRTIPTILEGMFPQGVPKNLDEMTNAEVLAENKRQGGLVPVTFNPVEATMLKLREMKKYRMAQQVIGDLTDRGLLKAIPEDGRLPVGYARIGDWAFSGKAAPEPVARVLNNYLSPGLRGNAAYDAYMAIGNTLNQAQLGFSAFHAGMTTIETMVSQNALALEHLVQGKGGQALKEFATFPGAPFSNYKKGEALRQAYLTAPGTLSGPMKAIADGVAEGGARYHADVHNQASTAFSNALEAKQYARAAKQFLPALMEKVMSPVMNELVPRQKYGIFYDLAQSELARLGPEAHPDEVTRAMQRAWDSVDNRMGQVVYDNLFWNKTAKDVFHASVRSVGWNWGTFNELGGGTKDLAGFVKDLATPGAKAELSHRAAYAMALPMTLGILGAVTQYLYTGKGPDSLFDMFHPKTGTKDADGNDNRVVLPSYMKDVYSYGQHPVRTLTNKMNPLLSMTADALMNKDFYGDQIYDEPDFHSSFMQSLVTSAKAAGQLARYGAKSAGPFGIENITELSKRGASTSEKVLSQVGITPASREAVRSRAQNLMHDALARRAPQLTPEEANAAKVRADLRDQVRTHGASAAMGELRARITDGTLTVKQVQAMLKDDNTPSLVRNFKRLSLPDAEAVYRASTSAREKQLWLPILLGKRERGQ